MLTYQGKEIEEPDPCVKGHEKPEEDKVAPPDEVMDAWERLSAVFELFASVDNALLADTRFTDFISSLSSDVLIHNGTMRFVSDLDEGLLVNQDFANGIVAIDSTILKNEIFRKELMSLDESLLKTSQFATSMLSSEPRFSESGELLSKTIIGGEQVLEGFAFIAISGLIKANGVAQTNTDVQGIVDTYFNGVAPGTNVRNISPNGFKEDPVTQRELDRITSRIEENIFLLESVRELVQGNLSSQVIFTSLHEIANELTFPDEWFFVSGSRDENAQETIYQANWKYSGLSNVPGFLAGGVGRGGKPPESAADLLDYRAIDRESLVKISLIDGRLKVEIGYNVIIGDTFDFLPGGGGFDDFIEDVSLSSGIVAIGVEQLQFLEEAGYTVDVPFKTKFLVDKSFELTLPD